MKVRAIESCIVGLEDGTTINVKEGQAFDRTDHVVSQHPWLFERDNVEQATSGPGERRNTRIK